MRRRFFQNGWNVFGFVNTIGCWLPEDSPIAKVNILLLSLRALHTLTTVNTVKVITAGLRKGLHSIMFIGILLGAARLGYV